MKNSLIYKIKYSFFGKFIAKIYGIEIYSKIISIDNSSISPTRPGYLPLNLITVEFTVNNDKINATATASNISYFDAKKIKIGAKIRIKYLPNHPKCIYITEFDYANKGIF